MTDKYISLLLHNAIFKSFKYSLLDERENGKGKLLCFYTDKLPTSLLIK